MKIIQGWNGTGRNNNKIQGWNGTGRNDNKITIQRNFPKLDELKSFN